MNSKIWRALLLTGISTCMLGGTQTMAAVNTSDINAHTANEITFYGATGLKEILVKDIKSPNSNPFGLVYEDAITKNETDLIFTP